MLQGLKSFNVTFSTRQNEDPWNNFVLSEALLQDHYTER